jgi:hypothetical protein
MFKQLGISSVELLISLSIASSVTAYTLTMAEEVEHAAKDYQQEVNVKEMLKKIRSGERVSNQKSS